MMNRFKKYLALTRAGIIECINYRMSLAVMVFGNLLYLTLIYFVWKAIFASSGSDVVNGMTFESTMIYLVLATALFNFMEMYIVWEMGRDIQSGKIALNLIRPMEYRNYLFWSVSGSFVVNFVFTFIPTFIIVLLVTKGTIGLGINLVYFMIAVILAVVINYEIDFIVGTICLYTESIWGINIMKQTVVTLLSGATIPLAFFPDKLRTVIDYLPFRAIYDTPLTLLLSDGTDQKMILSKLLISLGWAVLMSVISRLFWKVSIKQVTVNGG
ncbi:MAG: ABC-2 family transporter protein [Lachnospiraceae bacterium]|nr:ABC-2 family transporter protein [Lachnospiraceae bacterium]